jgi:hypothetical protein
VAMDEETPRVVGGNLEAGHRVHRTADSCQGVSTTSAAQPSLRHMPAAKSIGDYVIASSCGCMGLADSAPSWSGHACTA